MTRWTPCLRCGAPADRRGGRIACGLCGWDVEDTEWEDDAA